MGYVAATPSFLLVLKGLDDLRWLQSSPLRGCGMRYYFLRQTLLLTVQELEAASSTIDIGACFNSSTTARKFISNYVFRSVVKSLQISQYSWNI